jgi:hypothetical protein
MTNNSYFLEVSKYPIKSDHLSASRGVTTLSLAGNELNSFSGKELKSIIDAIPPHVKEINLQGNSLFRDKSPQEIDDLLKRLGTQRSRLDLRDNEESALARVLGPLSQMQSNLFKPTEPKKGGKLNSELTADTQVLSVPGSGVFVMALR